MQPAAIPFNNLAVCLLWHMERAATIREEEKINTQRLCDFFEEARKVRFDFDCAYGGGTFTFSRVCLCLVHE